MVNLSIVMGIIYRCSREVIKILSLVDATKSNLNELYNSPNTIIKNTDDPNYKKRVEILEKKFNEARNKMGHKYGDHLSLLNIYEKYEKMDQNKIEQWCYDNFIKQKSLQKAKLNAKKILYQLPKNISAQELGLKYDENIANLKIELRVLACLLMGFRLNTGSNKGGEFYRTQTSNLDKIKINKISFLALKNKLPKNIFYHEFFISMGKNDLNIVSEIPKKIIKLLS
jgi:HrpA-like RNA helicase